MDQSFEMSILRFQLFRLLVGNESLGLSIDYFLQAYLNQVGKNHGKQKADQLGQNTLIQHC